MNKEYYTIRELINITGVTKRTLHYYDKIQLLTPKSLSPQGHRQYDAQGLEKLQTILFLKELSISLKEMKIFFAESKEHQTKILETRYKVMVEEKKKLEQSLENIQAYIAGKDIFNRDIFQDSNIYSIKEQYLREAKVAYGNTQRYQEYEKNIHALSSQEKNTSFEKFEKGMEAIFRQFNLHIEESPTDANVQNLVTQLVGYFE